MLDLTLRSTHELPIIAVQTLSDVIGQRLQDEIGLGREMILELTVINVTKPKPFEPPTPTPGTARLAMKHTTEDKQRTTHRASHHNLPDATELRRQIKAGETTPYRIVSDFLARLEQQHHRINAATQIFHERAFARSTQSPPGPLSGIPISVKETFGLDDEQVTVGSLRMPPEQLPEATVVKRIKAAGAIIIARSNVPEFAMTGETTNLRFGQNQ